MKTDCKLKTLKKVIKIKRPKNQNWKTRSGPQDITWQEMILDFHNRRQPKNLRDHCIYRGTIRYKGRTVEEWSICNTSSNNGIKYLVKCYYDLV
jgi:hypothetical protein